MSRSFAVAAAALLLSSTPLAAQTRVPRGIEPEWLSPPARPAPSTAIRLPSRVEAVAAAERVSAAQIAAMAAKPLPMSTGGALDSASSNWVAAAYYVGAARLARVSDDPRHLRVLTAIAEHYNYAVRGGRSGETMLNADDIAIGDLYEELYARRGQPGTLLPLRQRLDWQVPHLARSVETSALVWWWCDALYMAPPVLARMSAITGDPKYVMAADKEWRRTAKLLWSPQHKLFFRDARFLDRKDAAGNPVIWSRGNGWVLGGLARWLESVPADFAGRDFYTTLFRDLSAGVAGRQRKDGLWPASLLSPDAFPEAETSGSAFFVYGLAWGINHGLLDRKTYLPHVLRGWAALNRQLRPDGQLGSAQKTGDQPVRTLPEEVGPYANGAYILAALEIADLNGPVQRLPHPEPTRDAPQVVAATTPAPPPPATVVGAEEVARRKAETEAVRALTYDPAVLGRPSDVAPLAPPPPAERRRRAVARFAPDRLDDLLWENDLVAHRLYGPALEAKEPPSGSGIDAWAKRVRWPFMDRQLKFPNYHVDRGEGLDFYDVGRTRGAGGLGIWYQNKLWTSRNFSTYRIDETGGDEARFTVDYRPWPIDVVRKVWETRAFSLPLGSHFTRMRSTLKSDSPAPLTVAIGIGKVGPAGARGTVTRDKANGRMVFWGPKDADHGTLGFAVMVDPAMVEGFAEDAENWLMLMRVMPGTPFIYYMGSAWNRGGTVKDKAAWEALVAAHKPMFR